MSETTKIFRKIILFLIFLSFVISFTLNYSNQFAPNVITSKSNSDVLELNNKLKQVTDEKNQISIKNEQLTSENKKLTNDLNDLSNQVKSLNDEINKLNNELSKFRGTQYSENNKVAYLTFDDGPSEITEKILDLLKSRNIKATFFVIGKTDDFSKKMYRRIANEGHTLALHTYSHIYADIYKSDESFYDDLEKLRQLLVLETGISPKFMRFAGGTGNSVSKEFSAGIMTRLSQGVLEKGYKYFDWNASSGDASPNPYTPDVLTSNILNSINGKNELIVLMHDSKGKQAVFEALPGIIDGLTKANYKLAPIDDNTVPYVQKVNN